MRRITCLFISVAAMVLVTAQPGAAQPLGVFRWQLSPFCNVLTLHVTHVAGTYRLEGFDDQCGALRAAVLGMAVPNPDGSLGFGLTIVATAGDVPLNLEVRFDLSTLGGPWSDTSGNSGTLIFNPGVVNGSPRPVPTLPAVVRGPGLAPTAARSDHTHQVSESTTNTAAGDQAMRAITTGMTNGAFGDSALAALTTGNLNTAVGSGALSSITTASRNTAVGALALTSLNAGGQLNNTAIGAGALNSSLNGMLNTAVGAVALFFNTAGSGNVAIGARALLNAQGSTNVAIGPDAGGNLTAGDTNIYIVNSGANESNTIRIGTSGGHHRAFIAGVRGVITGSPTAIPVLIDADGQLGTVSSSRRFKQDITDLGDIGNSVQQLRPVQFRYREAGADGTRPIQYGLIAEEVAGVLPELVAHSADGQIETVKYHILPTLLIAEVQRLERERAALAKEIAELRALVNARLTQR